RRGALRSRRHHAARPRRARRARAAPLHRPDRPAAGRRDARRIPARAARGEHRDVDPLPARAHAHVVPRTAARPAAVAGRRACGRRDPLAAVVAGALGGRHRRRDRCAAPRARTLPLVKRRTAIRLGLTLLVTGGCLAYIFWQLDVRKTIDIVVHSHLGWFFGAVAIMIAGVPPMAFRWQRLLAARGVHESFAWCNRAYFVSYTAGQVLPSAVGGDGSRIFESSRRHPGRLG